MIVDVFPFFNEYDLLELRLNELWPLVDKFMLSEATMTFSNKPKPLYFHENKDRFNQYSSKLEYVIVNDYKGMDMADSWSMDHGQKQRGLDEAIRRFGMGKGDIVILCDCDEIPRTEKIRDKIVLPGWSVLTIEMRMYYYHMNCQWDNKRWGFPKLIRLNGNIPDHHKTRHLRHPEGRIRRGGWHFSYLDDIKYKIDSFSHVEYSKPPYNDQAHIDDMVANKQDLYGRQATFKVQEDLDYLPAYVKQNMDKYAKYILKEV